MSVEQAKIRNFAVIAHIDHGKTTLTDRLLDLTGTVSQRDSKERMLDSNPIEQERGITIKLAPVTMRYKLDNGEEYFLNLIDTPGHVDFNYEVERSLAACEGAILLVDATKGVQAQTITNLHLAQKQNLKVLPVVNKIDAPNTEVEKTIEELHNIFPGQEFLKVSGKTGAGVKELLDSAVRDFPAPSGKKDAPLRALIFNSFFHPHLGAIAFIRIVDGSVKPGSKLRLLQTNHTFVPKQIGWFTPGLTTTDELTTGQVGYIATGFKDLSLLRVGDTIVTDTTDTLPEALPGYRTIQPHVYLEAYPVDSTQYLALVAAVGKLKMSDSALHVVPASSMSLGQGVRIGFLGLLHADIVRERLMREYNVEVLMTSPSVEYKVHLSSGETIEVNQANDFPDPTYIKFVEEPMARVTVVTPGQFVGQVIQALEGHRGIMQDTQYLGTSAEIVYRLPLADVITSLHDELKSISAGFATFDYQLDGFQVADLIKLTVQLNHEEIPALSTLVVRELAGHKAHALASHLKETVPRHMFDIPVQICWGGQVMARETVKAYRKDVTAKLYGGDNTRRVKLLEKQKKGKKKMQSFGKVSLPPEVFFSVSGQK